MSDLNFPPPNAVPFLELLASVPRDARAEYEVSPIEHRFIPYGFYCQEAAAQIAELRRVLAAVGVRKEDGAWTISCELCGGSGRTVCTDERCVFEPPCKHQQGQTCGICNGTGRNPVPGLDAEENKK